MDFTLLEASYILLLMEILKKNIKKKTVFVLESASQ